MEDRVAERLDHSFQHLTAVQSTRVVHGAEDAENLELRIEAILHLVMVSVSRAIPQSEELASSGMITLSAAVNALIVSRPSDGAQSIKITSYRSRIFSSTRNNVCSRATSETSCTSAAEVDVAGQDVEVLDVGRVDHLVHPYIATEQEVVDAVLEGVRVDSEADRERALRIEVDQKYLPAQLSEGGSQIDRGRGLADPALLVAQAMIMAGPWESTGGGSGKSGHGRPVRPSFGPLVEGSSPTTGSGTTNSAGASSVSSSASSSSAARAASRRRSWLLAPLPSRRSLVRARVRCEVDLPEMVDGDQGVNLGGGHRRMAKQLLNDPDVRASVQQMGGKGMSHRMRRYVSLDARLIGGRGEHCPCALPAQSAAPRIEQQGWGAGPRATSTGRAAPDNGRALRERRTRSARCAPCCLCRGREESEPDHRAIAVRARRRPRRAEPPQKSGLRWNTAVPATRCRVRPARCPPRGAANKV